MKRAQLFFMLLIPFFLLNHPSMAQQEASIIKFVQKSDLKVGYSGTITDPISYTATQGIERQLLLSLVYSRDQKTDIVGNYWKLVVTVDVGGTAKDLIIESKEGEAIYKSVKVFNSFPNTTINSAQISITSVRGYDADGNIVVNPATSNVFPTDLYLEYAIVLGEAINQMNTGITPVVVFKTQNSKSKGIIEINQVAWADRYEYEWVFIDKQATKTQNTAGDPRFYVNDVQGAFDFKEPISVQSPFNFYEIDMVYPEGYLYTRARAVGHKINNGTNEVVEDKTYWSNAIKYTISNNEFEPNKNWQYVINYAEHGKRKIALTFADGLFKTRQDVTRTNVTDKIIAQNKVYDYEGRPAINILPTPIVSKNLNYKNKLNTTLRWTSNEVFSARHFDNKNIPTPAMNKESGASYYYSLNNNISDANTNTAIPEAQGYPYAQTVYTRDNTGRIAAQGNVGQDYQITASSAGGQKHATKYFYAKPNSVELHRLFGGNVGNASHYQTNYVIDPNGQASVAYLDNKKRTIATALVGDVPTNLHIIDGLTLDDTPITVSLNDLNEIESNENVLSSVTSHAFFNAVPNAEYTFNYEVDKGEIFKSLEADINGEGTTLQFCIGCEYVLNITVISPDGDIIPIDENNPTINEVISPSASVNCTADTYDANYSKSFTIKAIGIGDYKIVKKLTPNAAAVNMLRDQIINNPAAYTNITEDELVQEYEDNIDYTDCYLACLEQRDFAIQKIQEEQGNPDYVPTENEITDWLTAWCSTDAMADDYSAGLCESYYLAMVSHVSPNGVLFENDIWLNSVMSANSGGGGGFPQSREAMKANWSDALLDLIITYHPEYADYLMCLDRDVYVVGNDSYELGSYLFKLSSISSWSDLSNDAQVFNNDPLYIYGVDHNASLKAFFENNYNNFNNSGKALHDFIDPNTYSAGAEKDDLVTHYSSSDTDGNPTGGDDFDITKWQLYVSLYGGVREKVIQQFFAYSYNYPAEGSAYIDVKLFFDTNVGDPYNAQDVQDARDEAYGVGNEQETCDANADAWWATLAAKCPELNDLDKPTVTQYKTDLANFCLAYIGEDNPFGFLTIQDLDNDLAASGNNILTSFQTYLTAINCLEKVGNLDDVVVDLYTIAIEMCFPNGPAEHNNKKAIISRHGYIYMEILNAFFDAHRSADGLSNNFPSAMYQTNSDYKVSLTNGNLISDRFQKAAANYNNVIINAADECNIDIRYTDDLHESIVLSNSPVSQGELNIGINTYTNSDLQIHELHGQGNYPGVLLPREGFLTTVYLLPLVKLDKINEFSIYRINWEQYSTDTWFVKNLTMKCTFLDGSLPFIFNSSFATYRYPGNYAYSGTERRCMVEETRLIKYVEINECDDISIDFPLEDLGLNLSNYTAPCILDKLEGARANARIAYQEKVNKFVNFVTKEFYKGCYSTLEENFTFSYVPKEYHYTLYYYDQADNLVQTVPPKGVHPLGAIAFDNEGVYIPGNEPAHTYLTKYRYNSYNQVEEQSTPDGGTTQFYYNAIGQIRYSVSERQRELGKNYFSYSKYDELGRIEETGESSFACAGIANETALIDEIPNMAFPAVGWDITKTYYDKINTNFSNSNDIQNSFENQEQENLRNRVASTEYLQHNGDCSTSTEEFVFRTHYSYDIQGNVKQMVQENAQIPDVANKFKTILYQYDLLTGNVNQVDYQKGKLDQFSHRYTYDADNRITHTETARTPYVWETDAKYFYYLHGPLARVELGQDKVQAQDYAYTLQGWLKGVNAATLVASRDLGKDGYLNDKQNFHANIPSDAHGFSLHYNASDYRSIHQTSFLADIQSVSGTSYDLYNGNIRGMVTGLTDINNKKLFTAASLFEYDQLNRLKKFDWISDEPYDDVVVPATPDRARATNSFQTVTNSSKYDTDYSYDFNGNIASLHRNGNANAPTFGGVFVTTLPSIDMDRLSYRYEAETNKLQYVDDFGSPYYTYDDIKDQSTGNYGYDGSGNLISDAAEGIANIEWNAQGKVKKITKFGGNNDISFYYGPDGNRTLKVVGEDKYKSVYTYYVRDAQGNVMATYTKQYEEELPNNYTETNTLEALYVYGSSRLGIRNEEVRMYDADVSVSILDGSESTTINNSYTNVTAPETQRVVNKKQYELTNHLGNVMSTVTDKKVALTDNEPLQYTFTSSFHKDDYDKFNRGYENQYSWGDAYAGNKSAFMPYHGYQYLGIKYLEDVKADDRINVTMWAKRLADANKANAGMVYISIKDQDNVTHDWTARRVTSEQWEQLILDYTVPNNLPLGNTYRASVILWSPEWNAPTFYDDISVKYNYEQVFKLGFEDLNILPDGFGEGLHQFVRLVTVYDENGTGFEAPEPVDNDIEDPFKAQKLEDIVVTISGHVENEANDYDGILLKPRPDKADYGPGYKVPVSRGDIVDASIWSRHLEGSSGTLIVYLQDENGNGVRTTLDESLWKQTSSKVVVEEWQQHQLIYQVPFNVEAEQLFVMVLPWAYTNKSYTWFDDLKVNITSRELLTYYQPIITSTQDYYPGGSILPGRSFNSNAYRFGFNGMEKDDEVSGTGNSYTAEFWQYDSRLMRRWNLDPVDQVSISNYAAFRNNPIVFVDPNGDTPTEYRDENGNTLANTNDGSDDIITISNDRLDEFKENVKYTPENMQNAQGWNDYWKNESLGFETTGDREAVLGQLNSQWSRQKAINYIQDPSLENAVAFSAAEVASQWTNPYLVIGGLSAGLAGIRPSPKTVSPPRNYPVRPDVSGTSMPRTLQPGEMLGRYGPLKGKWASPQGTSFGSRSIPSYLRAGGETKLQVVKPLKVNQSLANPGQLPYQTGYGVQYQFSKPINSYIPEYIKVVK
jgi:RHS repeat-associated protein